MMGEYMKAEARAQALTAEDEVNRHLRKISQFLRQVVGNRLFEALRHLTDLSIDGVDVMALPNEVWDEIAEFRRVLNQAVGPKLTGQLVMTFMAVRQRYREYWSASEEAEHRGRPW